MSKLKEERAYRHEYKFLIDERQRAELFYRLKGLIPMDPHVAAEGSYWIRSVYFDDYRDTCFRENESGVNERSKYRIRIYNVSDEQIRLERKSKKNGMTCKESAKLTREQCDMLLKGIPLPMDTPEAADYPEVLKQFLVLMMAKGMRAKTIVEYERIPFVYQSGNVRITFDRNLSSSMEVQRFFEKDTLRYPVLAAGQQLMEVKFDEYLPAFIKENLETGKLQQTSFSKYYLCRRYSVPCAGGRKR